MLDIEIDALGERKDLGALVEKILADEYGSCELSVEKSNGQIVHVSILNTSITTSEMVSVP